MKLTTIVYAISKSVQFFRSSVDETKYLTSKARHRKLDLQVSSAAVLPDGCHLNLLNGIMKNCSILPKILSQIFS